MYRFELPGGLIAYRFEANEIEKMQKGLSVIIHDGEDEQVVQFVDVPLPKSEDEKFSVYFDIEDLQG